MLQFVLFDLLVWAGIGDLVDTFRTETLKLPPIALTDGAALIEDHEVPFTYLWPASLVPKPKDWGWLDGRPVALDYANLHEDG